MPRINARFNAIANTALLIMKFGTRIPGGGYEVEVTDEERVSMSPHGELREVPMANLHAAKWQYFPNTTIEGTLADPKPPVVATGFLPEKIGE